MRKARFNAELKMTLTVVYLETWGAISRTALEGSTQAKVSMSGLFCINGCCRDKPPNLQHLYVSNIPLQFNSLKRNWRREYPSFRKGIGAFTAYLCICMCMCISLKAHITDLLLTLSHTCPADAWVEKHLGVTWKPLWALQKTHGIKVKWLNNVLNSEDGEGHVCT